jgi:ABC-2 type transport system permease protein
MRNLWRVYARWMKIHWAILLEYRGDTFFYMFGSFVHPLVTLAVWLAIAGDGAVGGYEQDDFVLYFLIVMFVMRINASWDPWEMEVHIREGTLSGYLLRPSSYFHYRLAENLVYKFFYLAIMLVVWAIAWPFFPLIRLPLSVDFVLLAVVTIVLGAAMRYLLYYNIGLLGFWTTRMLALVSLVEGLGLFLSGRIAPYALLPEWVQLSKHVTPFYWYLGFPVDVITGRVAGDQLWSGLLMQALWAVLMVVLYQVLWKKGLRKYGAVGG